MSTPKKDICPTMARLLLDYAPDTGIVQWKARLPWMFNDNGRPNNAPEPMCRRWNKLYAGNVAGYTSRNGYMSLMFLGRARLLHRMAFIVFHGRPPHDQLDHMNGDRSDNRICNLREVTNEENGRNQKKPKNNSSGHIGVSRFEQNGKWHAYIGVSGKQCHLGFFDDIVDAIQARKLAEAIYGFHSNHGRAA